MNDTARIMPFIEWHNEEASALDAQNAKVADVVEVAGKRLRSDDPDVQFALGKLAGKRELLLSFEARITRVAADQAGLLEPYLAEQADD